MDLSLYILFSIFALFFMTLAIYERAWVYTLFALPFLVILIASSFSITTLHAESLVTNQTTGEVSTVSDEIPLEEGRPWALSYLWWVFLVLDIAFFLVLLIFGDRLSGKTGEETMDSEAERIDQHTRRKDIL